MKKRSKKDKVEIKITSPFDTVEFFEQPKKTEPLLEVNISRQRSVSGTTVVYFYWLVSGSNDLHVEVDIEAGEEIATTDAVVDLCFFDFDEAELSIYEDEYSEAESLIEVDVLLDSISEEDGIELFPPMSAEQVSLCPLSNFMCLRLLQPQCSWRLLLLMSPGILMK